MKKLLEVSVVGGAGHIGLPLSCYISSFNHKVNIIDLNRDALTKIQNKETPFQEDLLSEYLVNAICSNEFCIVFKKSNLNISLFGLSNFILSNFFTRE